MITQPCPFHPEKVRKATLLDAIDGLLERFQQPTSHIRRLYKCAGCQGWHYTSQKRARVPFRRHPFPEPFWYSVKVDGRRVWQSRDQRAAERMARKLHGVAMPYMEMRKRNAEQDVTATVPQSSSLIREQGEQK